MMSEEKRLTDKELDGLDNLLDDIAIGRGNIEGVQALFLRWGNDLLEEVRQLRRDLTAAQETIAAKDGEIERLRFGLSQRAIKWFALMNGAQEVHRSWRDQMVEQGRDVATEL